VLEDDGGSIASGQPPGRKCDRAVTPDTGADGLALTLDGDIAGGTRRRTPRSGAASEATPVRPRRHAPEKRDRELVTRGSVNLTACDTRSMAAVRMVTGIRRRRLPARHPIHGWRRRHPRHEALRVALAWATTSSTLVRSVRLEQPAIHLRQLCTFLDREHWNSLAEVVDPPKVVSEICRR
jgi:hypothetical protein